ncbi:hypothetical protein [Secundilactobacillus paracollinoides]|uniref:hypothetical protein n=1 Tax=Secundilactobacillus paracollinoides TaxID=240427 RepID=UPI0012E763F9|nr:hypothetical protein [Secundilactobacillus paracollinoides]
MSEQFASPNNRKTLPDFRIGYPEASGVSYKTPPSAKAESLKALTYNGRKKS